MSIPAIRVNQPAWDLALKRDLHTPFVARLLVAGSVWRVESNSREILVAMTAVFQPAVTEDCEPDLSVSFFVDPDHRGQPPWQPYFRCLNHLVFASYGSGGAMLVDLDRRRVIGSFSPRMAEDWVQWNRVVLPVLLGIVSASIGITPLHSACLVKDEKGLVLVGESGTGKSTLALSLALSGFAYLSDDWTYLSRDGSNIRAWGLPTAVKLLPDAVRFFPQLKQVDARISLNGELALEVDPVEAFGVRRALSCRPRWLLFLERREGSGAVFERIGDADATARCGSLLEILPPPLSALREFQLGTIQALVQQECWVVRHGLTLEGITERLVEFCSA